MLSRFSILLAFLALMLPAAAQAQAPVNAIMGYMKTGGCPGTPPPATCFVAYGSTVPTAAGTVLVAPANGVRGTAGTTGTGATTLIAAQGAGLKIYVLTAQCFRSDTGTTQITGAFNDSVTTPFVLPPNGGSNMVFSMPLVVAANTALTFTMVSGVTTATCNAQGYAAS